MAAYNIYRPVHERVSDFKEVELLLGEAELAASSERCMACGIPFCHGNGCPVGNVIPEINAAVNEGKWQLAWDILSSTSAFPEFTGRVCPALCENSCTHSIDDSPVMNRQIEKAVVENAFAKGYVKPVSPFLRSGKKVAVVGSGPAGLATAYKLNSYGHEVTVIEKNSKPGGLLRYGIPDFKLNKDIIDRRLNIMEESGIKFLCNTEVGRDISATYLKKQYDAIVLTVGTPDCRDMNVPGRELKNIYQALTYLSAQNRYINGESKSLEISAENKHVLVIGGGDTGSDCVGTAVRQKAKSITQIDIIPEPPIERSPVTPWPDWPYQLKTSSSHLEGGKREWCVLTKSFFGEDSVKGATVVSLKWEYVFGKPAKFEEIEGSMRQLKADLVLLAMGFTGISGCGITNELSLDIGKRGTLDGDEKNGIFVAGDTRTGQSLVIHAVNDAYKTAAKVNNYLKGE